MAAKTIQEFFPVTEFGNITETLPLTMGQSGASVSSVTTETGTYVLRVHGEDRESWDRVALAQELASRHGIAPAVIHVDHVERATISVRVSGISFGAALSQPETRTAALKSLMEILGKLHSIPAGGIADADPIGFARSVWDEQVQREGFPAWATHLGDRIAEWDGLLQQDHRKVFSHCDLHPGNILWDGERVWLVDWERASLAHPYLDLATICNFLTFPDDIALSLLERQEQLPIDESQTILFRAIRDLCRIVYGAVFFRLIDDLGSVEFASREATPTLGECFGMLSAGKLELGSRQGRGLFGAALLKQCAIPLAENLRAPYLPSPRKKLSE